MDQQTLNTVLAGVAALASAVTVYLTIAHNRQRGKEREEDRRLVEEQLTLARDQVEMRPDLCVVDVSLREPDDSDAMEGSVDPHWIAKLRNLREVSPLSMVSTFLQQGRLYDKTIGEKVVVVTLANKGRTAAHVVTGWVHLEAHRLEPTKPSGGRSVSLEGGEYRVAVVGEKVVTLAPRRSLTFRIVVAVFGTGATSVRYDFVSSEGQEAQGSYEVST